jgi:hypothetical protein
MNELEFIWWGLTLQFDKIIRGINEIDKEVLQKLKEDEKSNSSCNQGSEQV